MLDQRIDHRVDHKTSFVDVGGKKTQITVGGAGPPLLYLHSASGETEWMPFHDELAENFTVYVPAHPGFGLSEGLEDMDDVTDMAWHYVDLLAKLGLEQTPVAGFSLGAWIGVELAVLRPGLVSKLMMTAAAGLHVEGAPMAELFLDDLERIRDLVFYIPDSPLADLALPSSTEDQRILMWLRAREATARVGWNPYLHNPKLPKHLGRVSCPTKILWGRNDKLIPLAHGEFYAQHIPSAELQVLDDCGHMVPFEKPEEFVKATRAFLRDS